MLSKKPDIQNFIEGATATKAEKGITDPNNIQKFMLKLPISLHTQLKAEAASRRKMLNEYIVEILEKRN